MSPGFRVLDAQVPAQRAHWIRMWERSPMQLPFAHPGYGELVLPAGGRLLAAAFEGTEGSVLYPLVLRRIGGTGLHDLASPYGYGGPLAWGGPAAAGAEAERTPAPASTGAHAPRAELARRFWTAFDAWAGDRAVVTEFVRLSLFDDVLPYPARVRPRLVNYVRELPGTAEELWAGMAPKVRQNVRRARRCGLSTRVDRTGAMLDDFLRIYHGTMTRLGSQQWYRFDREFFERLHRALPGRLAYVHAMHDGVPVSVDLVVFGADTAYYFLGGTDAEAFGLRPNELVKVHAMELAQELGCARFVLGGGVRTGDGLERYKRGFAPEGAQMFCSGERVLDPGAYVQLTGAGRGEGAAEAEGPDVFFPAYRSPAGGLRSPAGVGAGAGKDGAADVSALRAGAVGHEREAVS
ncbi:lipid II:glycine glycyltransferase FemX [Brevibacterium album]|uniref:lipid II:glycine glycyltransferase FemX n=1 Tax=Brevibacterium album TaxID=417948 RepID=UPI00041AA95F|nr:GNAT family N-acetyltransferase [Brevibacterium album]